MNSKVDSETEKEAIGVIKNLKEKNQRLSEDLKKKDFIIKLKDERIVQLENRLKKINNPGSGRGEKEEKDERIDEQNYIRIEDKSQQENHLAQQIRVLTESDAKMKSQLFSKDKIINDLEAKVSELEKQVTAYKVTLLEKTEGVNPKQHEQALSKLHSYNKLLGESEAKISQLNSEKNILENKLNQMIEIIKKQSHELNDFQSTVITLEREREKNLRLIEDSKRLEHQLNSEVNKLLANRQRENDYVHLERKLEMKIKNYDDILAKYSGENSPEMLKATIENQVEEINQLKQIIDNHGKATKYNEMSIRDLDLEIKEIINGVNNEIKVISQWLAKDLNPYLANPREYDRKKELNEMSLQMNKYIKNKIFFDDIKSMLVDFKGKFIEDYHFKTENRLEDLRDEVSKKNQEIYNISDKYSRDLSELQKYNENQDNLRNERMRSLNMLVKIQYEKTVDKIRLFTKNPKWTGSNYTYYSFTFEHLEDRLELIFRFLNDLIKGFDNVSLISEEVSKNKAIFEKTKKEQDESCFKHKDELNKFLQEKDERIKSLEKNLIASNEQNNAKLKDLSNTIGQLEYEKQKLIEKFTISEKNLNSLKQSKKIASNTDKDNFESLLKSYQSAEKKINSLTKELELKDMQLNSLSHMLNRRNSEIGTLNSKIESISTTSFSNLSKTNDPEKERLMKENLSLMNANYNLNAKVNQLSDLTNKSRNDISEYEIIINTLQDKIRYLEDERVVREEGDVVDM